MNVRGPWWQSAPTERSAMPHTTPQTDNAARHVAIQHEITRRADELAAGYQLLNDLERGQRLRTAANLVDAVGPRTPRVLQEALIDLGAETQAWIDALAAEAAR